MKHPSLINYCSIVSNLPIPFVRLIRDKLCSLGLFGHKFN